MLYGVISAVFLLSYVGVASSLFGADTGLAFSAFNAKVEIDIEDGEIEILSSFTLGAGSAGIDPATEFVALQVTGGTATYSTTIPAGSFRAVTGRGYRFQGIVSGVKMLAAIRPLRGETFEFELETERAKLVGMSNPVTVSLAIGDDSGSRSVRAKIE